MECSQQQTTVAATVTLYENFLEEKCECDLLIPDYYPAAEKIIQCRAEPIITRKEIEGDRLVLEGICHVCVIYQGEDDGSIKALKEKVPFQESLLLKSQGKDPWVQTILRTSATTCRLLNSRKISVKATVSVAVKVKHQEYTETLEKIQCEGAEALFMPTFVYTVLEHPVDTTKVQGEIEVHNAIQDILSTNGTVCIKSMKILPGKAIIKGVLNLFFLYTTEVAPDCVESTSTAVPFTQVMDLRQNEERGELEAVIHVHTIRTDVESDESGQNRLISFAVTLLTEGEIFENQPHSMILDAYSNYYPLEASKSTLQPEELCERVENTEILQHHIPMETDEVEIVQVIGNPVIQKISGHENMLMMDGVLDLSLFLRAGKQHRSIEKSLPFTVQTKLHQLDGPMRCEVRPCILTTNWTIGAQGIDLKTEICYSLITFAKRKYEVIDRIDLDIDHPLEVEKNASLVVYYGEKGERLWDIARRHATSVSAIKDLNSPIGDVLEERKLLLISR